MNKCICSTVHILQKPQGNILKLQVKSGELICSSYKPQYLQYMHIMKISVHLTGTGTDIHINIRSSVIRPDRYKHSSSVHESWRFLFQM
jgi:hypothetical protein